MNIKNTILEFVDNWQSERPVAKNILAQNKKDNAALKATLSKEQRLEQYERLKKSYPLAKLTSSKLLLKTLPELIKQKANLPSTKYNLVGSIGKGALVDVPWLCVFDNEVSQSAQDGYYIVYLFTKDLSGIYLSLAVGWTQFEKEFGLASGKVEIANTRKLIQKLLRSSTGLSSDEIDLRSKGRLVKGYELGTIFSKYYPLDNLPDDIELMNDLRNLLGVYNELKGLVGKNINDLGGIVDEETFQESVQSPPERDFPKGPLVPKSKVDSQLAPRRPRSLSASQTALRNALYLCENESKHTTFTSARTGHQFMEAHHLIPLEHQDDFEVDIDVPENIISLCPNCHRLFHNAEKIEKHFIVQKFFSRREELLKSERGIMVTEDQILQYYS